MPEFGGVAVVIPCHNEAATIGRVVSDFHRCLPGCSVFVADNGSSDDTSSIAAEAGATVLHEPRRGKGFAVRRLFADVDADCFVMVDGDDTYDAAGAADMVRLVTSSGYDMVNGARVTGKAHSAYRPGHTLGNAALSWIFRKLFRLDIDDTLSGYRALSRRFVKSFPTGASGFEIEAELNAHAALLNVPITEVQTTYGARPEGSESKLHTYRDGIRILRRNLRLFRDARPAIAFMLLAMPWLLVAALLMLGPVVDYLNTGLVARFPSLIVGVGFLVVAIFIIFSGVIMQRSALNRVETARLFYLSYGAGHLGEAMSIVSRRAIPGETPWDQHGSVN